MRTNIKLLLALLAGGALALAVLLAAGLEEVASRFARVDSLLIVIALAVMVALNGLRALKWKLLLRALGHESKLKDLFWLVGIGNFVNIIAPIRAGDLVRPVILAARNKVTVGYGLGSVAAERAMDLTALAILGIGALIATGAAAGYSTFFIIAFTFVLGSVFAGVIVVLLGVRYRDGVLMTADKILGFIPILNRVKGRALNLLRDLIDSLRAIVASPWVMLVTWILTFVIWLLNALAIFLFIRAFDVNLGFLSVTLGVSVLFLSFALPAAPGYVGSLQAVWLLVFGAMGLTLEENVAISIFYNTVNVLFVSVLGAGGLAWLGLSLGRILSSLKAEVASRRGLNSS